MSDYKIGRHHEVGVQFVNHEYDYRLTSDDTKSTYQFNHKDYNFREAQEIKILNEIIMLEYRVPDH